MFKLQGATWWICRTLHSSRGNNCWIVLLRMPSSNFLPAAKACDLFSKGGSKQHGRDICLHILDLTLRLHLHFSSYTTLCTASQLWEFSASQELRVPVPIPISSTMSHGGIQSKIIIPLLHLGNSRELNNGRSQANKTENIASSCH